MHRTKIAQSDILKNIPIFSILHMYVVYVIIFLKVQLTYHDWPCSRCWATENPNIQSPAQLLRGASCITLLSTSTLNAVTVDTLKKNTKIETNVQGHLWPLFRSKAIFKALIKRLTACLESNRKVWMNDLTKFQCQFSGQNGPGRGPTQAYSKLKML